MSAPPREEARARVVILLAAATVALGIALSGSVSAGRGVGGVALVLGWLTLVVGIHRFGRLGAP